MWFGMKNAMSLPAKRVSGGQKKRKNRPLCDSRLFTAKDKTEKICYINLHIFLISIFTSVQFD